ncbi:MAG: L-lactate permease, partial [Verrucomicrobiae bacterium]|nr:L-lactate permease [Verrucomicrobiae bacterium]
MTDLPILLLSLFALAPIGIVMVFLVVLRWPAKKAMPLAYIATVLIAAIVWKVNAPQITAASIHG